MIHKYWPIKDTEFDDLRAAVAGAEDILTGPFDDYDAIIVLCTGDEVVLRADRCERCGAFCLEAPFGGDYSAYFGLGTYTECPGQ